MKQTPPCCSPARCIYQIPSQAGQKRFIIQCSHLEYIGSFACVYVISVHYKKLTKPGIKVQMRADSNNGYVNANQVYKGKEGTIAEKGLEGCVVRDLKWKILGKYHHMYCDNYFTSVILF